MDQTFCLQFLATAVLAAALTFWLGRAAPALKLVDEPNHPRKKHENVAALTGGLAVFIAWLASLIFTREIPQALAIASALIVLAGTLDDFFKLTALKKLAMQIAATMLLVVWGGIALKDLGHILPDSGILWLGRLSGFFTVIALLLLLNAWNFIDGLDGLAAGVSIVTLGWLAALALLSGFSLQMLMPETFVIAAIIGFLPFNLAWRRLGTRQVFLGDAGSLFLGLMTGWSAILLVKAEGGVSPVPPMLVAWVLAFPVFDLICVAVRRMAAGHSPMRADKTHFHHLLCRRGMTPRRATALIVLITFLYGFAGFTGWKLNLQENVLLAAWIAAFTAQFVISARMTNIRK